MIAWLSGVVRSLAADCAVIDVNGVGYLVQASGRTLGALATGATAGLLVDTQVREESITLFGFATDAERDWFRLLTSVQGVGGRVALAILTVLAPDELARAVALEDRASIGRAQGVGPKLATRIVTELRGKGPAIGAQASAVGPALATPSRGPAADALSALANLGFRPLDASRAVAEAERELGDGAAVNDLIRVALKKAAR